MKAIQLINNLLTQKITIDEYTEQLLEIDNNIQSLIETLKLDFKKLNKFEPNLASKKFSKLINDCRIFEPNPDLRDEFEISEK